MAGAALRRGMSGAFIVLLVLAAIAVTAYYVMAKRSEAEAEQENRQAANKAVMNAAGTRAPKALNAAKFADADEDLIADAPKDAAQQLDPAVLTFSYVGGDPISTGTTWKELTDHLAKVTGKTVEYLPAANIDEQLRQLRDGKLHVTVINSGAVPLAVNECGFVPEFTMGKQGYTMDIIVPADSSMKKLEDLRGHTLTLVEPKSNSGYKAAMLLLPEQGLHPLADFDTQLSWGQKASIAGIANGKYEAAAVASDLLQREVAAGTIKQSQYKTIFQSKPYPQAAAGHAYNLAPALAKKVTEAFSSFEWKGTELEKQFAAGKQGEFSATRYKADWVEVRRLVDKMGIGYGIAEEQAGEPAATQP